jgi:hypothetical protein
VSLVPLPLRVSAGAVSRWTLPQLVVVLVAGAGRASATGR